MQVSNAIGSPGIKASRSSWSNIPDSISIPAGSRCLQEGWGHPACSVPSDSWDTASLPIKPRCHQLNWKVAGLHSCQRTWVWPVVFAFLVAKAEQSERAQGSCHSPSWACGYDNSRKKKTTKNKPKSFLCQVPLTAIAICSPIPKDPSYSSWCQLVLGSLRLLVQKTVCGPCQTWAKSCRRWFYTIQLKAAHKY